MKTIVFEGKTITAPPEGYVPYKDPEGNIRIKPSSGALSESPLFQGKEQYTPKDTTSFSSQLQELGSGKGAYDPLRYEEPKRNPLQSLTESLKVGFGNDQGKVEFLKKIYPDAAIANGKLVVKDKDGKWKQFNAEGMNISDIGNIPGHLLPAIGQAAGMTAGGLSSLTAKVPPILSIPTGGAIGSAAGESLRQLIGKSVGTQKDYNLGSVGNEALLGGATALIPGTVSGKMRDITKSAAEKSKTAKSISTLIASVTGQQPESIQEVLTRGYSNVAKPGNLEQSGIYTATKRARNALENYFGNKGVMPEQISTKLADITKNVKQGTSELKQTLANNVDSVAKSLSNQKVGIPGKKLDSMINDAIDKSIGVYAKAPGMTKDKARKMAYQGKVGEQLRKLKSFIYDKKGKVYKQDIPFDVLNQSKTALQDITKYGEETSAELNDVAKGLSEQLRKRLESLATKNLGKDNAYVASNATLSRLHDIDSELGGVLGLNKSITTPEKQLLNVDKLDIGRKKALQELQSLLPDKYAFLNDVGDINLLKNPDYLRMKMAQDTFGVKEGKLMPEPGKAISSILKSRFKQGADESFSKYKLANYLNKKIEKQTGQDELQNITNKIITSQLYNNPINLLKTIARLGMVGTDAGSRVSILPALESMSGTYKGITDLIPPLKIPALVAKNPVLSSELARLLLKKINPSIPEDITPYNK